MRTNVTARGDYNSRPSAIFRTRLPYDRSKAIILGRSLADHTFSLTHSHTPFLVMKFINHNDIAILYKPTKLRHSD